MGRYQVALVLGGDGRAGDGVFPPDGPLLDKLVELAGAATPEQLHEVRLRHPALESQGFEGGGRFFAQLLHRHGGFGRRIETGTYPGLEPGRKHQGEGGKQRGAVVSAQPPPQPQTLRAEKRGRFDGQQDIASGEVGFGG